MAVPDAEAANVVFANGKLIARSEKEFPASLEVLSAVEVPIVQVDMSELAKADGALTCCSLLL
ncbi:hypothetical protein EON62_03495 [archaeon]|nr:MAG: hypothetical protein EON62_03495 [archaeon]